MDVERNELQFSNVTSQDEGTYTCQARNADGYGEATIELTISKCKPSDAYIPHGAQGECTFPQTFVF